MFSTNVIEVLKQLKEEHYSKIFPDTFDEGINGLEKPEIKTKVQDIVMALRDLGFPFIFKGTINDINTRYIEFNFYVPGPEQNHYVKIRFYEGLRKPADICTIHIEEKTLTNEQLQNAGYMILGDAGEEDGAESS